MPILLSLAVLIVFCLLRFNIVIAILLATIILGISSGMPLQDIIQIFTGGLGRGAPLALSYGLLGAFAVGFASTRIPEVLCQKIVQKLFCHQSNRKRITLKWTILGLFLVCAIASQNIIPIHIAFIPILIPPLLPVLNALQVDRRQVACLLIFGLTATYGALPLGFGHIYLEEILMNFLINNGVVISEAEVMRAMWMSVSGMGMGLLYACFIRYAKPRNYVQIEDSFSVDDSTVIRISKRQLWVCILAILGMFSIQLWTNSIIFGALVGILLLKIGGVIQWNRSDFLINQGFQNMVTIGLIMICAAGFAAIIQSSGAIESFVSFCIQYIGDVQWKGAVLILGLGQIISVGIGSSFSTIPILAPIAVPIAQKLEFSPMAIASLIGTAAMLGDVSSPASEATLGATMGLSKDNQHSHMADTVFPALNLSIPLFLLGIVASLVL